jgi:hypothetical protein
VLTVGPHVKPAKGKAAEAAGEKSVAKIMFLSWIAARAVVAFMAGLLMRPLLSMGAEKAVTRVTSGCDRRARAWIKAAGGKSRAWMKSPSESGH